MKPSDRSAHLDLAVRRLRGRGAEVVVGTCPDLGTIQPIPQPLRLIARALEPRPGRRPDRGRRRGGRPHGVPRRPPRPGVRRAPARDVQRRPVPPLGRRVRAGRRRPAAQRLRRPRPAGRTSSLRELPRLRRGEGLGAVAPARPSAPCATPAPRSPAPRSPARPAAPGAVGPSCCAAPPARPGAGRAVGTLGTLGTPGTGRTATRRDDEPPGPAPSELAGPRALCRAARLPAAEPGTSRSSKEDRRARGRHRRHRPQPDRAGVQGVAQGDPPRRPRRPGLRAVLDKVPRLDPQDIDDLYWGCAEPSGRQGCQHGPRRRRAGGLRPAAWRDDQPVLRLAACRPPGWPSTRSRPARATCSSPAGSSACPSTELGRRRWRRRRRQNPLFADAEARTAATAPSNETWTDPRAGRPAARRLHRHGPDRRERRDAARDHPRAAGRVGRESQNRAEKAIADGFFEREITPVTMPDGTVVAADDGPRAGRHHRGRQRTEPGVPRGRHGHRRQLLPAQRRRRRRGRHERHQGAASSASPRSPGSWRPASPASPPRSWASARSRRRARRWPGPA